MRVVWRVMWYDIESDELIGERLLAAAPMTWLWANHKIHDVTVAYGQVFRLHSEEDVLLLTGKAPAELSIDFSRHECFLQHYDED